MKLGYPAIVVTLLSGCFADGSVGVRAAVVAPAPVVVAPAPVVVEPAPVVEQPPPPEPAPVVVDEEAPDLVEVSPGVQVIYDYDEPIFFSDGFYWREENGVWFSSRSYRGGWGRYAGVPVRFRGNFNARGYAHYRPAGYTPRHGVRVEGRGEVRGGVRGEPVRGEVRGEPVRGEVRGEPARVEGHGEVVHGEVHGEVHGTVNAHPAAPAHAPAKTPPKHR